MTAENAKNQTFSNNATRQILGFEYQKIFALDCCLKSKPGDIIYIECYGDVATKDSTHELKLRAPGYIMTDQSPDFWKTLQNFVKERHIISQFSKLILHTTATVESSSIFFDWTLKDAEQKLRLIKPIREKPNKSIKEFTEIIFDYGETYSEKDLLEILKKFEINYSQIPIKEKCNEIKQSQAFLFIDENRRDALLELLYGYISMKAIEDSNLWKIVCNDFIRDIQGYIGSFQQKEIPYPDLPADYEYTGDEKFRFIDELKAIELVSEVQFAFLDYIRSEKNSIKLIEMGGDFVEKSITNFESELESTMKIQKQYNRLDLEFTEILTPKAIKLSKKLYLNCKKIQKMKIRGVQPIEQYYQHGKMHKIVEERGFCWSFLKDDFL